MQLVNLEFIPASKPGVYTPAMDTERPNHIGTRIDLALKASARTQAGLAEHCGVSPQAVFKWIKTGQIGRDNAAMAADYLQVSFNWLLTGRASGITPVRSTVLGSNVEEAGPIYETGPRKAPIISWVQAGEWCEAVDPYALGDGEAWREVPRGTGARAFWLRVKGDSMSNPYGTPSIPDGALILVDPDVMPENGKLVVAKLEDSQEVTFKKLVKDAGRTYLSPLNPKYETVQVNGNCSIVGTVRKYEMDL